MSIVLRLLAPLLLALLAPLLLAPPAPAPRPVGGDPVPIKIWLESGPSEKCVDVLFVGDGYTAKDLTIQAGKYWKDVQRYAARLFKEEPFLSTKSRFNVRALFVESPQRGCDASPTEEKFHTALESHFDSPEGRLLVFKDARRLKELVEQAGPADLVFVMVNTERYGGAGTVLHELRVRGKPCPAPTFSAQDTASFLIAVHELGHSFAGLVDEYEDEALQKTFPLPEKGDVSAPNATLPRFFDAKTYESLAKTIKWGHFLALADARKHKWLIEGAYYRAKGVFRPWPTCRMLRHDDAFCPVCAEEVAKAILASCGDTWDDARWHKEHPLSEWR